MISEVSIHGVFVEEILKPRDPLVRNEPFSSVLRNPASFDRFRDDVRGPLQRHPNWICGMAQSSLKIPMKQYFVKLNSLLVA